MCGIAGFSYFRPNQSLSKKFFDIEKLISHRGPENTGSFVNSHLNLLHTRLSIVDIKGGNQPIENSKYVLIVNGEIYNDLEIRKKNKSYKYSTLSDSESILALYDKKGLNAFKDLRGMYAFVLYDKKLDEVIIGRDEFGIKPLYFSKFKEGILFCSEIKPIKNFMDSDYELNIPKLSEFMQLQYSTGTGTIYKNIHRVEPGQILVIKRGEIKKSILNSFKHETKKKVNITNSFIEKSLSDSISSHLRSDVPYCLFFSGGIDSMLLLYYLHKFKKDNITAFSVFFDNESTDNIDKITRKYNIDLVKEKFTENDFWEWIFFAAQKIDEPIADYAILPTFKLAAKASKNFKVAITGEGGDELFGGYGRYKKTQRMFFKKSDYLPRGAFDKVLKNKKFINWEYELKNLNSFLSDNKFSLLQKFQLFDYYNWLPNNLLVKLDRCLMTYGMEGRTPFIDKKLFNDLFHVRDREKVSKGYGKLYIRKFLQSRIPELNFFNKKTGFSVPIYDWIPKKINHLEELLLKQKFLQKYFSKDELKYICQATRLNSKFSKPLWHIIFFTSWYLVNIIGLKKQGDFFDILSDC